MEQSRLPPVGKQYSLVAVICLGVAFMASGVALVSPDWISFSYDDLEYSVQNSRSVIPLLPKEANVKLTAGVFTGKVCWDNYPMAFLTCQGGKMLISHQLVPSGAKCDGSTLDDPGRKCTGCVSGGVDSMVNFMCGISFNFTNWDNKLPMLDSKHIRPDLNATQLCDDPYNLVVSSGQLCNPDRLFFRVGYPGYSTIFLICLDLIFIVSAFTMALCSLRSRQWQVQVDIGCCPLAKGGWILSTLAVIFSVFPVMNFVMQSYLERGEPQVINDEGNNVQPVVPSDVSSSQGSDVQLKFGWGLLVYAPIVQICLGVAAYVARKAVVMHEQQYEQNLEVFFPELPLETESKPLVNYGHENLGHPSPPPREF